MIIKYSKQFIKNFKRRIEANKSLKIKFFSNIQKFQNDPQNRELKNHKLFGSKKGLRSFSMTGDIRIIYKIEDKMIIFYDIGSHNQVY